MLPGALGNKKGTEGQGRKLTPTHRCANTDHYSHFTDLERAGVGFPISHGIWMRGRGEGRLQGVYCDTVLSWWVSISVFGFVF